MSEFIAESTIIVKADTRPFAAQLKKAATQAETTKITLTVRASTVGFRNDLLAKLKSSQRGVIVRIPVRPDFKGFRAALIAGVQSSARGVTVPVSVAPTPAGAAAAGGAGAVRVTAPRRVTDEVKAAEAAQKKMARLQAQAIIDDKKRTERLEAQAARRVAIVDREAKEEEARLRARVERVRRLSEEAALPPVAADPRRALRTQEAAQERAATAALREESRLRKIGRADLANEVAQIRVLNAALAQNTAQTLENNAAARVRVRQSDDIKRAAQSQLLTFAGLRGAALSAESAFLFAAAGTIAFVKALQSAAQLESTLGVFRVTAGATADEMERVRATALELGRDITLPAVNAQDAAEALTELTKAGLGVEDSIAGARGVLQLATAAAIDNAQATELAASALNAFGLAGGEASHVADVLANAANDSQGSIVDMGIALQQSAAVAKQAGLSLEQTVGVLTLFARAGLRGSDAGTSLRTMLIRLINPTKKAQEVIDRLGLGLRTATGAINLNVFDQFARATKDQTAAQRDQALAIIFGQDAIRGAAIGVREGNAALDQQIDRLNRSGTAADVAAARMVGLTGSIENLKNQLVTVGQVVGATLIPTIEDAVDLFASLITNVETLTRLAANPIEIVVKLPSLGGPEDQRKGFFARIGDEIKDSNVFAQLQAFQERVQKAQEQFTELSGVDVALFPTVKQATKEIGELLDQLRSAPRSASGFNEVVQRLIEIQKGMAGGTERTKEFARNLQPLITDLQNLSAQEEIVIPATLGIDVLGGQAREAGSTTAEEFKKTFLPSFVDTIKGAGKTLEEVFGESGRNAARQLISGLRGAARSAAQDISRLQSQALDIEIAGGTPQQQLVNLRAAEEAQRQFVAAQKKLFDVGKISKKDLDDAKRDLVTAIRAREALEDEIARDAEQAANERERKAREIEEARNKADQAFLDALGVGRRPAERRIARAQATEGAQDDIAALLAFQKRLKAERDAVATGVKDAETRAAELRRLDDELFQVGLDLAAARKRRDEAIQAAIAERGVALVSLGEVTGNIKLIIQGLDLQIQGAREVVAKAKQANTGQEAAQAALEKLRKQRRDTINEAREALLGEAFRLAEARGQKSAMLQIIDLQIKQSRLEERQARNLIERLTAQANTAELIAKKKEILEDEVKKGTEGTTAFDLLQQFSEQFNRISGNLINLEQPFAGPTGFTADIAQFLKRRRPGGFGATAPAPGRGLLEDPFRTGTRFRTQQEQQTSLTTDLIAALKQLTDAILSGSGNDTTGGKNSGITVPKTVGKRWFNEGHWARNWQDS